MSEARAILDAHVSEAELQASVIACAQALGYKVAHFRPARTSKGWRTPVAADGEGFPDCVLARDPNPSMGWDGRVIFVEHKSETGRLRPRQRMWLEILKAAGAEVYVWRPRHWSSGEIERILR